MDSFQYPLHNHFLAHPHPKKDSDSALLAFSPPLDETNLGAKQHIELTDSNLELNGKNLDNMLALK